MSNAPRKTPRLLETAPPPVRVLVVAVDLRRPQQPLAPELAEFEALIEADRGTVVERVIQRRGRVDPKTMIGPGLAAEIAERLREGDLAPLGITAIFFFNELRPRQRNALEKILPLPIIDRTMLILDIFAQRARSRQGRVQVELAQLRYRQSHLIGAGADLSRLGGGIGSRGPGETKLEVDRRRIGARVSVLRKELEQLRTQRAVVRGDENADKLVALVGYTNVGKSSLLNRLSRSEGRQQAFVADQPFATLDPTMRRVYLSEEQYIRAVDTVGFITELPKELVNAFMATLEELGEADILLHVIDAANPDWVRQKASVETILETLHLPPRPVLLIANKCDRLDTSGQAALPPEAIAVSADTGAGIDALRTAIEETLARRAVAVLPEPEAPHAPKLLHIRDIRAEREPEDA